MLHTHFYCFVYSKFIGLDKSRYQVNIFSYFSTNVGTHLIEASIHNICFYGEIRQIFINTFRLEKKQHLIKSYAKLEKYMYETKLQYSVKVFLCL